MAQPWVRDSTILKEKPFRWRNAEQKKLHESVMVDCHDMDQFAQPAREAGKIGI